jgi:hypothetical protein
VAAVELTPSTLTVRFTRGEKLAGLVRDVAVPLSAVREVEVMAEPLRDMRGLRAPGLALPGVRKIGTWRRPGERTLVSVRKGQPAVRVRLTGQRYATLLIGTDEAAELAPRISAGRPAAG